MSEREFNANANAMRDDHPNSEAETEKQGNLSRQADHERLYRTREIATQASDTTTRTPVEEGGKEVQNSAQWTPMSASLKSSQSSQSQSSCAAKLNTQETTRIISQTPAKKTNNTVLELPGEQLNSRYSNNDSLQKSQPSVLQSPSSTSHSPAKKLQGQHPLFQLELQPQSLQSPSQSQTQSQSQSLLDSPAQSPKQSNSRRHLITAQQPSGGAFRGHIRPDNRDSVEKGNNGHENGDSMSSAKRHAGTENIRAKTTNPSNDNVSFNDNASQTANQPEYNNRGKQNTVTEMESCTDEEDGVKEQPDDNIIHSNYSYYRGTTRNLLTQPQSSDDEDGDNDGKEGEGYPSDSECGFPLWKRNRTESESMISEVKKRMSTENRRESNLQLQLKSKESLKLLSNICSKGGDLVMLSEVCTKEDKNGDEKSNRLRLTVAENVGGRIVVDGDGNTQLHHLHAYSELTESRQQNNHILQQQQEKQQGPGDATPPQRRQLQQQTEISSGMGVDRTSLEKGSDISNQNPQHSLRPLNGKHQEQHSTEVHHYNKQEQQQTKESSGKNESYAAMEIDQAPQRNGSDDLNKDQLHPPNPLLRKQQQGHRDTRTQLWKEHQEQRRHETGPIDSQNRDSIAMPMDQTRLGNRSDEPRGNHQMQQPPTSQNQQQVQRNSRARRPSLQGHGEMNPTAIQNEGAPPLDVAPSSEGKKLDESNANQLQQLPQPLSQKQQQEVPNSQAQKPTSQRHRETKQTAIQNETFDAIGNDSAPVDESNRNQQQLPNPLPRKQQQDVQNSRAQQPSSQQHREMKPTAIQNETSDGMGNAPAPDGQGLGETISNQQQEQKQNRDHQRQKTNPNVSQYKNSASRGIGQVSPAIGLDDTNESKQRQTQPPRQKQCQDHQNTQIRNSKEQHQQQQTTISKAIHNATVNATMIEQSTPGIKLVNPNRNQERLSHPSPQQRQHDQEDAASQQQQQMPAEQRKTESNVNQNKDATVLDIDRICPRIGLDESFQIERQLSQPPPQQNQQRQTHEQQHQQKKETASHIANISVIENAEAPSRNEMEESYQIEQQRQFPREKEQDQESTQTLNQNEQHQKQTDAICRNDTSSAIDNALAPPGKGFDESNKNKQHPTQLPKKHQPERQNTRVMPQKKQQQQTKTNSGRIENSTSIDTDYPGNALDESHQHKQQPPQLPQKEQLKEHYVEMQNQMEKQQHQSNALCSLNEGFNVMAEKEIDEPYQHQKYPEPPHKQQQEQQNTHPQSIFEQHNQNQKHRQKIIDSTAVDFEQASPEEISEIPKHSQKTHASQNEKYNAIDIDQSSSAKGVDEISVKTIPFSKTSVNPSIRREDDVDYVTNVEGVGEVIECGEEDVSVQQSVLEKDVEMKDDDENDATGDDLNHAKFLNRQSLSRCSDKEKHQLSTDLPSKNPETSIRGQNGIISGLNEKSPDESSTESGQDRTIYGNKDETNHPTEIEKNVENKTEVKSTDPGATKGAIKNFAGLIDRSLRRSRSPVLDEEYMQVVGLPSLPVQPPSKASEHQQRKQQRMAMTDICRSTDTNHPSPVEEADDSPPKDVNMVEINGERSFSRVEETVTKSNAETGDQKDLADPNLVTCGIRKRSDNKCSSKPTEQSLSGRIHVEPSLDVNGSKQSKTMNPEAESTMHFTPSLQNASREAKERVGVDSSSEKGTLMEVDHMVHMEKKPLQNNVGNIPSDKFHSNGTMAGDRVSELKKEGISLKLNGGNESARERLLSPALSGLTEHSQSEIPRENKNALETPADATHSEFEHPTSYRSISANRIWTSSSIDDAELQGLTEDVEDKKAIIAQVDIGDEMKPSSERAETKDEIAHVQLPSGHRTFSSQTTVLQEATNENGYVAAQVLLSGLHVNAKAEMENVEKVDGANHDKQVTKRTENSQVRVASESAEWSLYAGETQPLPTPPSFGQQRLTIPSKPTSLIDAASDEVDSGISKGIARSMDLGNNQIVCSNAETNFTSFHLKNANYQRQNNLVDSDNTNDSDESRKKIQHKNKNEVFDGDKPDNLLAITIPERTEAGSSICKKSNALDHSESRDEPMKHTPDHDSPPMLPYPDDQIEPKLPESKDRPPVFENASYSKESEPGERSQESQDLLDGSRNVMPDPVENRSINISDKNLKNGDRAVQKPASHGQASCLKELKSGAEPKDTGWTSSNRYPNGNENRSPPRLVLPSFKTSDKTLENELSTRSASGQNSPDASDDGSWCEPVAKAYFSDFIEDTQSQEHRRNEVKRVSSLKRLSRGPSTSTKDDDESTSEEEFESQNYQSQSSTSIAPKILSYGMEDEASATSSSRSRQLSGSNADDHDSSDVDIEPSQTNLNVRKQLQKMKSMAMNLPDAKELKYIISREELLEKIDSLHRKESEYKAEINHYKAVMKDFETENRDLKSEIEKLRKRIKEKNSLLCEQAKYLETYAKFQESLQRVKKDIEKSPRSTRDHSPKPKRMKKRREHDIHSDDSDTIPLSKLKSTTPIIHTKRKTSEAFHDKHHRRGIASTNPTPKSNGPKSGQKPSGSKKNSTKAKEKPPLSSEVWKILQEKGWVYRTGPEPYNKVYVPKDGATHPGTQLGIHFFHSDQVIQAAVKRGDLSQSHGFANLKASELASNETNDETEKDGSTGNGVVSKVSPFDSPETHLKSQILTLESAELCINLAVSFARNNIDETVSFRGLFFDPLWQRLKTQGSDIGLSEMNWRYEKNPDTLSTRNWCFVTPCSNAGVKGKQGEDYFVSEEQLVLRVMSEVVSLQDKPVALSRLISDNEDCISTIFPILSRAVDENLEFHEARDGKSASVRSSRVRNPTQREESTPTKVPNTSRKNPKPQRGSKESTPVKRSPSTSISKLDKSSTKKSRKSDSTAKHLSPSFHLSQSQSAAPQVPTFQHRSPPSKQGPLSGFYFLMSGVDKLKLSREVRRLGGEPIEHFSLIQQEKYRTKMFFLSDYGNWRNPKYIIAASLGVPMLHHNWVADISKEHKEHGMAKVFSSDLYSRHRLPTGLDISTGVFALQRASHARRFLKPGVDKDGGNSVFDGMRIALGLENGAERSWKLILETCGAKVETASSIARGKATLSVDCCLFDSATLPPQETSVPVVVSRLMKFIDDHVPRLDLSWAHQCIIQRRRLPLRGETRYSVSLEGSFHDFCQISSFKSKAGNRYGVGDLVQISRGQKSTSKGRILGITWSRNEKECQFEVQLLESSGDYELVDCPLSAKVSVNERCLQGNIVMLDTKDFHKLGYIPTNPKQSNIFLQTRPSNESQR